MKTPHVAPQLEAVPSRAFRVEAVRRRQRLGIAVRIEFAPPSNASVGSQEITAIVHLDVPNVRQPTFNERYWVLFRKLGRCRGNGENIREFAVF